VGNIEGFTYLLQGDVEWKEVMKSLKHIGYKDFLIPELPPFKEFPQEMLYQTSRAVDRILEFL